MELIIEKLETEEDVNDLIEYDETMETVEEVWTETRNEEDSSHEVEKEQEIISQRAYKYGSGNRNHQCECGIAFSSNHRLRNHIRVKHDFVPESELLPCNLCDKK